LKKYLELIRVNSDLGAGTRGADCGADALIHMAKKDRNSLLSKLPKKTCFTSFPEGYTSSYGKSIEKVFNICHSISNEVCMSLESGYTPIVISGDHSCATGTIAGIKMARNRSKLGIVYIDAHADLHSPYTTPSGNMHGMTLAASLGENNIGCSTHIIDHKTYFFWDKMKTLGYIMPKVLPQHLVYVSLRDLEEEEEDLIDSLGIKNITTQTLRRNGITHTVGKIFEQLKDCTDIYVSFDTDSLEGSISKGTGLPVNGGLLPSEAEWLVTFLLGNPRVTCFEITEFNPSLDENNVTKNMVYNVLERAIATLQNQDLPKQMMHETKHHEDLEFI
jgi:arginase